jgi:hypothetical protein
MGIRDWRTQYIYIIHGSWNKLYRFIKTKGKPSGQSNLRIVKHSRREGKREELEEISSTASSGFALYTGKPPLNLWVLLGTHYIVKVNTSKADFVVRIVINLREKKKPPIKLILCSSIR